MLNSWLLPLLMMRVLIILSETCHRAHDRDNRVSVSCVNQNLSDLPNDIDVDAQTLLLSGNRFLSLSWSIFERFPGLHWIDLSDNQIHMLQPKGPVLQNMSILRLSGNRLTALGELYFRSLPCLTEIYLDRNRIYSLHEATFSELPLLEVIDLSQNKLPVIPPRLLEQISSSSLKTFDLENNSVSLIPNQFFSTKPELPYVYLSLNPWICNCSITYLHTFLNDQEHNIYKHDGPNNIIPAADTVVCFRPLHLLHRPIIELEEEDFCPQNPPIPKGDGLAGDDLITTNDRPLPQASTKFWNPNRESWVTESWTQFWAESWTDSYRVVSMDNPKRVNSTEREEDISIQGYTEDRARHTNISQFQQTSPGSKSQDSTMVEHVIFQSSPLVTEPIITIYQPMTKTSTSSPITSPTELGTSGHVVAKTVSPTITLTRSSSQTKPLITLQSLHPTHMPSNVWNLPRTETPKGVSIHSETGSTDEQIPIPIRHPSNNGSNDSERLHTDGRVFPWCWWIFSSLTLLCILSGLVCCLLLLWLLRIHLIFLKHLKKLSHSPDIMLSSFRCMETTWNSEGEDTRVSFLPLNQVRDSQITFRSVLFIDKREGPIKTIAEDNDEVERVDIMNKNMFRNTLYRMLWREEEVDMPTEELQRVRSEPTQAESSAHYSLILREDRGDQRSLQWLIGEWEMDRAGMA